MLAAWTIHSEADPRSSESGDAVPTGASAAGKTPPSSLLSTTFLMCRYFPTRNQYYPPFLFFFFNLFCLFIIFGCVGSSLLRGLLSLRSTGSRHAGSVVVAHWLSRSAACGIFPDQGSNPCPLHWQADS